jgi:hypothetical protein
MSDFHTEYKMFSRSEYRSPTTPKDHTNGSQPLTIVSFSLIPDIKKSLQTSLDDYRSKEAHPPSATDREALKGIISEHLPKEIIDELKSVARKGGAPNTVYVIKNLPEIEEIEPKLLHLSATNELDDYIIHNAYTHLLQRGIGLCMGLKFHDKFFSLSRYSGTTEIPNGSGLHKDAEEVTMMGGIWTNGAGTLLTDLQTLIEEAKMLPPQDVPEVKISKHRERSRNMLLSEMDTNYPGWLKNQEIFIEAVTHEDKFKELLLKHSKKIVVEPGDLVIWVEDGRLFHQALTKKDAPDKPIDELTRCVVVGAWARIPKVLDR